MSDAVARLPGALTERSRAERALGQGGLNPHGTIAAVATLCVLWVAPAGGAQSANSVAAPARVRVLAPALGATPVVATVTARRTDSLVLDTPSRGSVALPFAAIERLELSRGATARTGTGALVGLVVGTAATAAFLALFCNDPDTLCEADEVGRAFVLIAAPATGVGALIGSQVRTERWERVGPERFVLSALRARPLRLGLALRL